MWTVGNNGFGKCQVPMKEQGEYAEGKDSGPM